MEIETTANSLGARWKRVQNSQLRGRKQHISHPQLRWTKLTTPLRYYNIISPVMRTSKNSLSLILGTWIGYSVAFLTVIVVLSLFSIPALIISNLYYESVYPLVVMVILSASYLTLHKQVKSDENPEQELLEDLRDLSIPKQLMFLLSIFSIGMSVYSIAISIWASVSAYIAIASGAPILGLISALMIPILDSYIGDRYEYSVAGTVAFAYLRFAEFVGQSISAVLRFIEDAVSAVGRVLRTLAVTTKFITSTTPNWTLLSAIGINLSGVLAYSNLRSVSESFHQALELFSKSTVVAKPPSSANIRRDLTRIFR